MIAAPAASRSRIENRRVRMEGFFTPAIPPLHASARSRSRNRAWPSAPIVSFRQALLSETRNRRYKNGSVFEEVRAQQKLSDFTGRRTCKASAISLKLQRLSRLIGE